MCDLLACTLLIRQDIALSLIKLLLKIHLESPVGHFIKKLIFDTKPFLRSSSVGEMLVSNRCLYLLMQEVEIGIDDGPEEQRSVEKYHFAMSGKSFAVITEHFQDLLQKVRSNMYLLLFIWSAVVLDVVSKDTQVSVRHSQGVCVPQ